MTFTELKTAVKDYCNLSSTEADTRIGKAINRHYRRITSSLGMDATRYVSRSASMTIGVSTVTFTDLEKVDRVVDVTDSDAIRLLDQVSLHELRSTQPTASEPTKWALQNTDADSAVILFDTVPQSAYSLRADGWTTLTDLSGSDEPAFPESFHDILVWYVTSEELLKKEKDKLAATYAQKADALLKELRFHLADSHTQTTRQGGGVVSGAGGSSSGGGSAGGSSYTQTGLITFDRDPSAPFAVTDTSAYVPHLFTEGVGNVTTDRLIGRDTTGTGESEQLTVGGGIEFTGSGGIQTSALTGDVTKAAGGTATTIAAGAVETAMVEDNAITYAKMQNVSAASRLIGRGSAAGAGDPEEIALGTGLSMSGTTLNASAGVTASGTPADNQVGVWTSATAIEGASALVFDGNKLYLNDDANVGMTRGVTLNQGAADDEILTLKSSDVAHGVTDITETDTFGRFRKVDGDAGGLQMQGLAETGAVSAVIVSAVPTDTSTGKTTGSFGAVRIQARKKSGTGVTAMDGNSNLLSIDNDGTTRFIFDADGDSHQDVGTAWTNFDDADDLARLDAVAVTLAREGDPLRDQFVQHFEEHRAVLDAMPGKPLVQFNEDGHHFVNMSRLTMLLTGAVRQLARANEELVARLTAAERKLLEG